MLNIYIYIQKARHFSKSTTIFVSFYLQKARQLPLNDFHAIFEIGTFIQKHDTLRYMTFIYTKSRRLRKNQDNLC